MKVTTKLLATCVMLALLAIATVAQATGASGISIYTVGSNGAFGKIDTGSGAYTQINANVLGGSNMPTSISSNGSGGFYLTGKYSSFHSVDTSGVSSQIAADTTSVKAYGMSLNSADSKLYAYKESTNKLGTINTATGAYTDIGATGKNMTNNGLTRGRLAFQNGILYGTFYSSFGKFDLTSGLYTGEFGGSGYTNMVLASGATNLWGIYNGSILTLDPTTGGYNPAAPGASYATITGDASNVLPTYWTGAAFVSSGSPVPEPATLLGFGLPMLMVGIGKLRGMRK